MSIIKVDYGNVGGGGGACEVLIPNMTGASSPSGTASADTAVTGYEAYYGFNDTSTKGWYVNNASYSTHWIKYEFPSATIARATMVEVIQNSGSATATYALKGSNDDSTWDTLISSATASNNRSDVWTNFQTINSPKSYKYYRWDFSASTTTTASVGLKLNLFG